MRTSTPSPISNFFLLVALIPLVGCAGFNPANVQLKKYEPGYGYQPTDPSQFRDGGDNVIYLAFSGGGTRAAAFAYGVLQELRDSKVESGGKTISLLEEVDTVSGVSGGSFPAAYYGLFDDRIFEEFAPRFLYKNVQGALTLRVLAPWNLVRLMTPWLSRSDLASDYYDKHVFDGATFRQFRDIKGPRIYINATDLSSGERFTFNQGSFDIICSDLDAFPVSTAVAASSAVPMLLSPITLKNFAGTCGYQPPEWVAHALQNVDANPRRKRSAAFYEKMLDPKQKPFIHLVDGGISDNLGLRASIDLVSAAGGMKEAAQVHHMKRMPDRMAVIVVNAETDPNPMIDFSSAAPSFAQLMNSVSGGQIRRYNFETLMLMQEILERGAQDISTPTHKVEPYFINVSFDHLEDEKERRKFKHMPTSFVLTDNQVDDLIEIGRRLVRESPEFQRLLADMQ